MQVFWRGKEKKQNCNITKNYAYREWASKKCVHRVYVI